MKRFHPIGTPGQPWTRADVSTWLATQVIRRSYADEVRRPLEDLPPGFEVKRYGALSVDTDRYPLFAVQSVPIDPDLPWAVVTGGVHGYETSGVQGALQFLRTAAFAYAGRLNLLVAPCISPWGYERIHRWNPHAVDPNRSFVVDSPSEEAAAFMALLATQSVDVLVHIDLHETTDSDEDEFRPALAARDGKPFEPGLIPDGFYVVGDTDHPVPDFQAAVIRAVEQVTHIAPPDADGQIIGCDITQPGVINYPVRSLGLCAGVTDAPFRTTTEVYPDSPRTTAEQCNAAQVAAVRAALDYALSSGA